MTEINFWIEDCFFTRFFKIADTDADILALYDWANFSIYVSNRYAQQAIK